MEYYDSRTDSRNNIVKPHVRDKRRYKRKDEQFNIDEVYRRDRLKTIKHCWFRNENKL